MRALESLAGKQHETRKSAGAITQPRLRTRIDQWTV
jgi:hypothetical protein